MKRQPFPVPFHSRPACRSGGLPPAQSSRARGRSRCRMVSGRMPMTNYFCWGRTAAAPSKCPPAHQFRSFYGQPPSPCRHGRRGTPAMPPVQEHWDQLHQATMRDGGAPFSRTNGPNRPSGWRCVRFCSSPPRPPAGVCARRGVSAGDHSPATARRVWPSAARTLPGRRPTTRRPQNGVYNYRARKTNGQATRNLGQQQAVKP